MQRLAKITGVLYDVGPSQLGVGAVRYGYFKMEKADGRLTVVDRVMVPVEVHAPLAIGKPFNFFLARRGLWNFCYAIEAAGVVHESYRGYFPFYAINRIATLANFALATWLVLEPATRWAGLGLLLCGVLLALFRPPSIPSMQRFRRMSG